MRRRAEDLYLVDIVETTEALGVILSGASLESFRQDDTLRSAVSWKPFVIAEAASRLSPSIRARCGDVPWDDMQAFRNRMAHGYFSLDWTRVWKIAQGAVPPFAQMANTLRAKSIRKRSGGCLNADPNRIDSGRSGTCRESPSSSTQHGGTLRDRRRIKFVVRASSLRIDLPHNPAGWKPAPQYAALTTRRIRGSVRVSARFGADS